MYRLAAASLALFFAAFSPSLEAAQDRGDSRFGPPSISSDSIGDSTGTGRITGTVHNADGHNVANANIEARDLEQGTRYVNGRTDSRGSFALYNILPGTYEVTATAGVNQAHERVQVGSTSSEATVDFRLASKLLAAPRAADESTVSLAQYLVPAKARSLYEKAKQSMQQGKRDESSKKLKAALDLCPKFSEALTLRGILQLDEGKLTGAIADFQQAIEYDANYALAHIAMGSAFNSSGRFDESLLILGPAERLAPNAWQTYFELARAHLGKQEFAIALRNADRATELQGGQQRESPELHLVRGYALLGLAEIPRAVHELEAFLARKPSGRIADVARGVLDNLHEPANTASK